MKRSEICGTEGFQTSKVGRKIKKYTYHKISKTKGFNNVSFLSSQNVELELTFVFFRHRAHMHVTQKERKSGFCIGLKGKPDIFTQGSQQQEGQVEVSRTLHQRSENQTFYNLHLGTVREVHV